MKITIKPGKLNGTVTAPPSKSYAHRMLISAAFTDGWSEVSGISSSEDMLATLDCLAALGVEYEKTDSGVRVKGLKSSALNAKSELSEESAHSSENDGELPDFPCRESGSTLRFMIPIALAVCGGGRFTGAERLIERGIGIYEEIFQGCGISVEKTNNSILVRGKLSAGEYKIRGDVSSQFITGMLFALSLLTGESRIEVLPPVESRAYIDITIDVLKIFGVQIEEEKENCFIIRGAQNYQTRNYQVEGDWSNAAFLYAFNAVGNELDIRGLNENSIQGDKICVSCFEKLVGKCPDTAEELSIDLSGTPDLGPVLFAASAALRGGYFTGTKRLRIKESDRAQAMAEELKKFGVKCLVGENEVIVLQSILRKPEVPLNGHNDHRIVMALSVLAALTGAVIEGAEAVRKSWPEFFEVMKGAGLQAEISE